MRVYQEEEKKLDEMENKYYNQIDSYLRGQLSHEQEHLFEKEMQQNPDLEEHVSLHMVELASLNVVINEDYKQKIKHWINKHNVMNDFHLNDEIHTKDYNLGKPLVSKRRRLLLIAVLILSLIVAWGFWSVSQNYSNSGIVAQTYQPKGFTDIVTTLSNNSSHGILSKAKIRFDNNKFKGAINLLNTIPDSSTYYITAQYNLGILYFRTQQYTNAISTFSLVNNSNDIRYAEDAEWYLVLSFLQTDNLHQTNNLLNLILQNSPDSTYRKRATKLNNDLNSFWRKIII